MLIRKSYNFSNTHKVKNCSSTRCKYSIHSHQYLIEVFFEWDKLDNGMMVLDFGLTKQTIKDFLGSFDKAYTMWSKESQETKDTFKKLSKYYVETPCSPSAEAYSLMLLYVIDKIIKNTQFNNGEWKVQVYSVRVHETTTGFAESFQSDLKSTKMPKFELSDFIFNDNVKSRWKNPEWFNQLLSWTKYINPIVEQQVK